MSKSEELKIAGITSPSPDDDGFFFMSDKKTNQMSFEPLENIQVNTRTDSTAFFSAHSLGRRVRGFYGTTNEGDLYGEVDFVTPLKPGEFESF